MNTGRGGLAVAQGGDLAATNPEMAAYYNALAQQDAALAAQAQEQGRAQTQFGAGLFGTGINLASTGYSPLQTQLGLGSTVEDLGMKALGLGAELGGRVSSAGANAGQFLLSGGLKGAETAGRAGAYNPFATAITNIGKDPRLTDALAGMFGPYSSNPSGYQYAGGMLDYWGGRGE